MISFPNLFLDASSEVNEFLNVLDGFLQCWINLTIGFVGQRLACSDSDSMVILSNLGPIKIHRATSIFVGGQLDGNWRGISLAHTPGPIQSGEAQ